MCCIKQKRAFEYAQNIQTAHLGEPLKPLKTFNFVEIFKTFNLAENSVKNLYFDEKIFIFGSL